jgi:hypothetical protein
VLCQRICLFAALILGASVGIPTVALSQGNSDSTSHGDSLHRGDVGAPTPHVLGIPDVRALRTLEHIVVDGRLTEPGWAGATSVTGFTQLDPSEGLPVTQHTEVRVLYDDDALYVGAVLHDTRPVSLRVSRRDASFTDSDVFAVSLDSYHDHQTAFRFVLNASGVRRDEVTTSTGGGDVSWDPVWEGTTSVTDSGWVAEMRIPFSQLRFSRGTSQTWGIQFERRIASNQEYAVFAFTPKRQRGGPPRFAHLLGVRSLAGGHRAEVLPYAYGRASFRDVPQNTAVPFANPFLTRRDFASGFGADVKYRVTSNFTLDATLNPDFGQVEVDPAVLNLSQFEVRFDERRPFFVEGAEIFRFGSALARDAQLLYSRRVGRAPQGSAGASAAYSDVPQLATILGAAKLTGKTTSGWSLGLLEAVTQREQAAYVVADGSRESAAVEPLTNYLTARVKRSTTTGGTSLGGLLTAVNRALDDEALAQRLRSSALVVGADFRHEWGNRDYSVAAQLVSSAIRGRREVITAAQRSSARYFQRPDAEHLAIDSMATSLRGYNAFAAVGKFAGDWQRNLTLSATSPSYEINDLGFQTTTDRIGVDVNVSYRQNRVGRVLRRWDLSTGPDATWNFGGDRVGGAMGIHGSATTLGGTGFSGNYHGRPSALDERLTRGGPLARRPFEQSVNGNLNSDPRRRFTVGAQGNRTWNAEGGFSSRAEVNLGMKPASNWDIRVGPELSRSRNISQYVTSFSDVNATGTFGRRHVFATLDQSTLSMDTRVNVAFSPGLTLEVYAQPLIGIGDYGALKEFRTPGGFDFAVYGHDVGTMTRDTAGVYRIDPDAGGPAPEFAATDRDFSFRSLRGNAVLRWEWHTGSTLFLVWQQSRARNVTATGSYANAPHLTRFDPYLDAKELFGLRPDNVFQVKVTFWMNP